MALAERWRGPWPLAANRVSRFYRGGGLLEEFRGGEGLAPLPGDAEAGRPEDWVGSATRAWTPPGSPPSAEGLSRVALGGRQVAIADLLADDPVALAGADLVAAAGPSLGVLVKLLDAGIRLPVHAHPTRAFAQLHLGSYFGKAEAWIVIATRQVPGEPPPHVRLGFRRPVGRAELRELIERQRSPEILELLRLHPARPGDVWFVPPGVPHAIGAGLLIAEVQEPTDLSIVAETAGYPVDPGDAHLRLGWDLMIDVFDRRPMDARAIAAVHRGPAHAASLPADKPLSRTRLTPPLADPFFRAERWRLTGEATPGEPPSYLVGIVVGGSGEGRVGGGRPLSLARGVTFAVPAAGLPELALAGDRLDLIACLPPVAGQLNGIGSGFMRRAREPGAEGDRAGTGPGRDGS